MTERCIFYDPNEGECRRRQMFNNSGPMEQLRQLFRTRQIDEDLMSRIVEEVNKFPSLGQFEGDQRDNRIKCMAAIIGEPVSLLQTWCNGYLPTKGRPAEKPPYNTVPQVLNTMVQLLESKK